MMMMTMMMMNIIMNMAMNMIMNKIVELHFCESCIPSAPIQSLIAAVMM